MSNEKKQTHQNPHFPIIFLWLLVSSVGFILSYLVWSKYITFNLNILNSIFMILSVFILTLALILVFINIYKAILLSMILSKEEILDLWKYKFGHLIYFSSLKVFFKGGKFTNLISKILIRIMPIIIIIFIFLQLADHNFNMLVLENITYIIPLVMLVAIFPFISKHIINFLKYPKTACFTANGVFYKSKYYNFKSESLKLKKVIVTYGVNESLLFVYVDSKKNLNNNINLKVLIADDKAEIAGILADYYNNKIGLSKFIILQKEIFDIEEQIEKESKRLIEEEEKKEIDDYEDFNEDDYKSIK